jgi:2-haloacid dehalogenase
MPEALGFDIYGTLVDPLEMNEHLGEVVGEGAERFSALWREKQIEYTWRRGLHPSSPRLRRPLVRPGTL